MHFDWDEERVVNSQSPNNLISQLSLHLYVYMMIVIFGEHLSMTRVQDEIEYSPANQCFEIRQRRIHIFDVSCAVSVRYPPLHRLWRDEIRY